MDEAAAEPPRVHVVVKTLDDTRYEVDVPEGSSVQGLKAVIEARAAVPVDRQRLIFRGRTLSNAETLAACSIVDGSTVHLVARLGALRKCSS
jgi:ubiquilin